MAIIPVGPDIPGDVKRLVSCIFIDQDEGTVCLIGGKHPGSYKVVVTLFSDFLFAAGKQNQRNGD
jgi:hypothetical protein